jgi:hypothetical protein
MDESIIIAVNETFTPLKAISKLRSLPLEKKDCGIFFNFTMLPPGVSQLSVSHPNQLYLKLSIEVTCCTVYIRKT